MAGYVNMLHPTRIAIIEEMAVSLARGERDRWSPVQLAEVTGVTLGTVAYHVRELARAGVIALVAEEPVRGAVAHFYALEPGQRVRLAAQMEAVRASALRAKRALAL